MNLFRFSPDPDPATGSPAATQPAAATTPQETPEQKATRLEAELAAEREKVKNQNSYITKLEAGKKTAPAPAATVNPGAAGNVQPSAAEVYAIRKATEEAVEEAVAKSKELLGEEAAAAVADEVRKVARANIQDPFNIPKDMPERIVQTALGRAMTTNPEKRAMIAGAYAKQPAAPAQPATPPVKPTVVAPAARKIGTMQPGDAQPGLGPTQVNVPQEGATKPVGVREFFQNIKKK